MAIPQTIKDLANKVRTAVYGKDVRESLAKSMEETGNLADETKTRQDSLESQFQNVLDETTGKDVISAPEITAARGNHPNLKDRLDTEHTEVMSSLAQTEQEINKLDVTKANGDLSDFANSWWCNPRSIYHNLRHCIYQGGVNSEGTIQIAKFDLRRHIAKTIDLGTFEKDDHNVPAFLFEDDKPPITAYTRHAIDSFVRMRTGTIPHDIESLENAEEIQVPFPARTTYVHLIRKPNSNTIALLTRGADGWYKSISNDWGVTWGAAIRFFGSSYGTFRKVGNIVKYANTVHPITDPNNNIRYFEIDLITGDVRSAHSSTVIGNLWTGTEVMTAGSMTVVNQSYDPETNRVFDVGRGGSISAMKLDKTKPELGGTYGVYRFKNGGLWTWEPIVASGVPVGYYQSSYVGGMAFGGNDDSVWLARENNGTWSMENWKKTNGTWTLSETIKSHNDRKLGRPQIPWGAEGTGLFTAVEYWKYATDSFMNYYSDQFVLQTDVIESVI